MRATPIVILIAAAAVACANKDAAPRLADASSGFAHVGDVARVAAAESPAATPAPRSVVDARARAHSTWLNQKLIRSAELRVQVADIQRALEAVASVARTHDAFVADSRANQSPGAKHDARVVVKVPSHRFDDALAELKRVSASTISRSRCRRSRSRCSTVMRRDASWSRRR